jgi:hypothetical protein
VTPAQRNLKVFSLNTKMKFLKNVKVLTSNLYTHIDIFPNVTSTAKGSGTWGLCQIGGEGKKC